MKVGNAEDVKDVGLRGSMGRRLAFAGPSPGEQKLHIRSQSTGNLEPPCQAQSRRLKPQIARSEPPRLHTELMCDSSSPPEWSHVSSCTLSDGL